MVYDKTRESSPISTEDVFDDLHQTQSREANFKITAYYGGLTVS